MWRVQALPELRPHGLHRVAVAIGVFDGLHRGHQAIVAALRRAAAQTAAAPVVLTFDPHPERLLHPRTAPRLLVALEHRLKLLADLGVAATVVLPFTPELAGQPPAAFVRQVLLGAGLDLRAVCIGARWRFGHRARGDLALLRRLGQRYGFAVTGVPETAAAGGVISSTRVRQAVEAGDLATAAVLLGRPFSVYGHVIRGRGRAGRDLHRPTANLAVGAEVLPPLGIYVARAHDATGAHPAVLYLGYAPTFVARRPPRPFLEVHLLDYQGDLYGRPLTAEFLEFIRPDRQFPDAGALRRQIQTDVAAARRWHARH